MNAYMPLSIQSPLMVAYLSLATFIASFILTYWIASIKFGRLVAWTLVFFNISFIHWFCISEPAGFRMLVGVVKQIERAMGDGVKRVYESELPIRKKLRKN